MKKVILILLFMASVIYPQISKQVLTPAQKDSIKRFIADSLNANARGWQNAQQVRSVIGDSLNANSRGWRTQAQAKADAIDTIKVVSIESSEPSGSAYAIINSGGTLQRVMLSNLPMQTQVALQFQALLDSIARLRASIGGIAPTNPLPVTNLQATAGDGTVTLTWTNPSTLDSVVIERASSLTGGTVFSRLANVGTSTSYTDTSVNNGNTYTYRLRVYYQGFASSGVTIDATPTSPYDRPYYLTIRPTSVNYDTISRYNLITETITVTAETDGEQSGQNLSGIAITRSDSSKVTGNYGYDISVTDTASAYGYYFKNFTYKPNGDTLLFTAKVKIPYNFIGKESGFVQYAYHTFSLLNTANDIFSNKFIASIRFMGVNNNLQIYSFNYRTGQYTTSSISYSSANFVAGNTYEIGIKYIRNSNNTDCRVVFYFQGDSVAGANNLNLGNGGYPESIAWGVMQSINLPNVNGQRLFYDDITINGVSISEQQTYKVADIIAKNDSSVQLNFRQIISPTSPFSIISGNTQAPGIPAGDSLIFTVKFNDDTIPQLYSSNLSFEVFYPYNISTHTQSVSLQGNGHGASSPSGGIISADYYFDAVLGNDANDGTSPLTAWKTATKFNNTTFPAGSVIAFRDSMTYKGYFLVDESGSNGNPITITNWYDTTSRKFPFIEGAGATSLTNWTLHATNIWKTTVGGNQELAVWFFTPDTVYWGKLVGNIGGLDAEYKIYYESNTLYVYSPTNPITRYTKVLYDYGDPQSNTASCVTITGQYITLKNLQMGFTRGKALKFMWGSDYSRAENITASYNGKSNTLGVLSDGGDGIYVSASNITVERCTSYEGAGHNFFVWGSSSGTIQNVVFDGCVGYNSHHTSGVDINSSSGNIRNVTVKNSYFYNTDEFARTYFSLYTNDGAPFIFIKGEMVGLVKNIYMYNNIFRNSIGASVYPYANCDSVYIYNNTFVELDTIRQNGNLWNWCIYGATYTAGTMQVKNNIFYVGQSESNNYIVRAYNNSIIQNNVAYRLDGSTYLIYPYDPNYTAPINSNPQFVNPNGTTPESFKLQLTSPARDAGQSLSGYFTTDRDGVTRPQGTAWDIGAYEYVP